MVERSLIDCHVHLAALPEGRNGCYISPHMLKSPLFRFLLWKHGLSPDHPSQANRKYVDDLLTELRASRHVRQAVILGLDGLEPTLTERFLEQGLLPNLAKLKERGSYQRMQTTCPPLSPVAWSSFATGSNPGKHNIFDFISRDPKSYQPIMSSVRIRGPKRTLKLGRFLIPLSRPEITGLRKSKPFWTVLGESRIFSAVLRVPITFPPDRFSGIQLAAMCVPDLLGSQGTFSFYCEHGEEGATHDSDAGGQRILVKRAANEVHSYLKGPANSPVNK